MELKKKPHANRKRETDEPQSNDQNFAEVPVAPVESIPQVSLPAETEKMIVKPETEKMIVQPEIAPETQPESRQSDIDEAAEESEYAELSAEYGKASDDDYRYEDSKAQKGDEYMDQLLEFK